MVNEQELIQSAQLGDQSALAILLQQNYSFLVKYLIKITFSQDEAYDIAQETMVRCIEKIHLYNGTSKFSSWLITIATRILIDRKRSVQREQRFKVQEQNQRKLQWVISQYNVEWSDTLSVLCKTSESIRIPIILKYYYDYSLEEIAKMLNIPVGTVKSRIHNGLKMLRKELRVNEKD